jgi:hypothetical protein
MGVAGFPPMAGVAAAAETGFFTQPLPPAARHGRHQMLFAPHMSHLLAAHLRRPHAPTAPRNRRELLRGLRFPRRSGRAAAVRRFTQRAGSR